MHPSLEKAYAMLERLDEQMPDMLADIAEREARRQVGLEPQERRTPQPRSKRPPVSRSTDAEIEGLRRFVVAHTDAKIEGLRRFVLDHVGALAEEAGAATGTLEKQQRLLQQDIERLTTEVAVLRAEIERLRALRLGKITGNVFEFDFLRCSDVTPSPRRLVVSSLPGTGESSHCRWLA
jgi:hypothetical protein